MVASGESRLRTCVAHAKFWLSSVVNEVRAPAIGFATLTATLLSCEITVGTSPHAWHRLEAHPLPRFRLNACFAGFVAFQDAFSL